LTLPLATGYDQAMRWCALLVLAATGCNNPVYLPQNRPLETRMAMTQGMQQGGYQADSDLWVLPVRQPTPDEMQQLTDEQNRLMLPMAVPWVAKRDFDVEIEYTIKNLDQAATQATVTLLGGNEFGDYNPMLYIDPRANLENQTVPPPLAGGTPLNLDANQTLNGVFREDQIGEASIDLEAITRYPDADVRATPFEVIEHLSTTSPIGLANVPPGDVTPMMCRFLITLSSPGHVALDYTVRVRDYHDKIANPTDPDLYVPTDAMLAPPVLPPMLGAAP
jgi:hypothetical protein